MSNESQEFPTWDVNLDKMVEIGVNRVQQAVENNEGFPGSTIASINLVIIHTWPTLTLSFSADEIRHLIDIGVIIPDNPEEFLKRLKEVEDQFNAILDEQEEEIPSPISPP